MTSKWDKYLVYFLLAVCSIVFTIVVFETQNSFGGGGDHYTHFKLAYWGWKYPDMLFNHWGKPAFTILISPFAQFGINGARLYNILMGLFTAYFVWLIAKHFNFRQSWAVVLLVLFTPIYFILMFTSLTEVTFSLFLILAIYLFFKDKHILSAIVLSFLPLIRTEGIILVPLFILAWLVKRKFITLPFISVGFIIISFFGWPFYNSFWWLVTEMPYTGSAKGIYGSGPLLHFIDYTPQILSIPLGWLFVAGSLVMIVSWIWKDKGRLSYTFYFLLLVVGSFVTFFAAHSYVWWKGIGNSLGLIRVIGSVTPLAALTAMAGISILFAIRNKWWTVLTTILLIISMYYFIDNGITKHKNGFYPSKPLQILSEVADYIQEHKLDNHKIYYFNSYLSYKLNLDPRDSDKSQHYLPRNENFLSSVPDSSIIVWDAHFGPNEGRMPLEKLKKREELNILNVFKPVENFKVLGGYDYQVVIFQKDLSNKPKIRYWYIDFEHSFNNSGESVFKGDKSFKLEKNKPYKTLLDVIYQEISDTLSPIKIDLNLAYNYPFEIGYDKLLIVCTLETKDDVIFYKTVDIRLNENSDNIWHERSFHFDLPVPYLIDDRIKIYFWNKDKKVLFIDEVFIHIKTVKPEND